jgi:ABC-type antimicrobial peptide transport system permease subunit
MIKTRTRKILRDVWARKGRTALVSLAIFIGVAGTIALFSMSNVIVGQLRKDVKQNELAMATVALSVDPSVHLDDVSYLKMINNYPGITQVMAGLSNWPIYFKLNESDQSFKDGFDQSFEALNQEETQLVDVPFQADMPLQPMRLLKGGQWPASGSNQLLVERRMASNFHLNVGDSLYLRILSPSRDPAENGATGTVEKWTIVGIVFDPYNQSPKTSIYTTMSDGDYITGVVGFGNLWLRFTDYPTAEKSLSNVLDLIAKQTPYVPVFSQKQDPAQNSMVQGAQTIGNLMGFLALVALVVSGFLVINVITSLVAEQKRQIGVMKSMGATRTDNFFIYSGIAFVYGLIGVILGVIVGIPGGNAAAHALAPQVNTVLEGFKVSPPAIILGIIVGLLVPVLASLIPVFNGTRVHILDAMTDLGIDARYGSGLLAKIIARLPIPITVRQGLSNVSIKKTRLAFTVITLAVAVGAFMGIYGIFATFRTGIQAFIDTWNIQYGISPSEARDPNQIESILRQNFGDQIKSLEPGFAQLIEFQGYAPKPSAGGPPGIFAYGYDINSPDPAFKFTIDKGAKLTDQTKDNGIILSSLLAANMHKTVGDTVVLKVPGNTVELKVVGISNFPIEQAWMDWQTLAQITDYTFDTITSSSPIPAGAIPPQASGFIKYATLVTVDGYQGTMPDHQALALGLLPSLAQYLRFDAGNFFTAGQSGIIISKALADQGGYKVGDTLKLTSVTSQGTSTEYPIVGIFEPPPVLGQAPSGSAGTTTQSVSVPADFIGMYWRDLTTLDGATVVTEPRPELFFVTTTLKDPSASQISDVINQVNDVFVADGIPITSFNFVQLTEQISSFFFIFQAILSAVAGLIALVGALGLLTTLSMSVYERQKEIGVMRSIGASSRIVATQFLTEGMVVGVIAWIVGLPLMVLIQWALLKITNFDQTFPLQLSPTAAVIGLIGMLIITTIASLWPSLSAARKTVSDILRYQ